MALWASFWSKNLINRSFLITIIEKKLRHPVDVLLFFFFLKTDSIWLTVDSSDLTVLAKLMQTRILVLSASFEKKPLLGTIWTERISLLLLTSFGLNEMECRQFASFELLRSFEICIDSCSVMTASTSSFFYMYNCAVCVNVRGCLWQGCIEIHSIRITRLLQISPLYNGFNPPR